LPYAVVFAYIGLQLGNNQSLSVDGEMITENKTTEMRSSAGRIISLGSWPIIETLSIEE
jgi:hypothetical protein